MADKATVRAGRLDPAHGLLLTRGDLRRPFERSGFDWQLPAAEGVLQNHFPDRGELRLNFSGDQPEGVLALYQSVPVLGGGSYWLTFRYRTQEMPHTDGLSWQVWDYAGQRTIPASCELRPRGDWGDGEARFTVPAGVSVVRLGLVSERASGSTRVRGTISLRNLALTGGHA
jgi:hypothetical protein